MFTNCTFRGNVAPGFGGAIWRHNSTPQAMHVINCTFTANRVWSLDNSARWCIGAGIGSTGITVITNSILVGNIVSVDRGGLNSPVDTERQFQAGEFQWPDGTVFSGAYIGSYHSCISNVNTPGQALDGFANIDVNPQFEAGTMRIRANSPCVDRGRTYIDVNPFLAGFQPLPETDAAGGYRVTDGDGDGDERVDIGAYEVQESSGTSN